MKHTHEHTHTIVKRDNNITITHEHTHEHNNENEHAHKIETTWNDFLIMFNLKVKRKWQRKKQQQKTKQRKRKQKQRRKKRRKKMCITWTQTKRTNRFWTKTIWKNVLRYMTNFWNRQYRLQTTLSRLRNIVIIYCNWFAKTKTIRECANRYDTNYATCVYTMVHCVTKNIRVVCYDKQFLQNDNTSFWRFTFCASIVSTHIFLYVLTHHLINLYLYYLIILLF